MACGIKRSARAGRLLQLLQGPCSRALEGGGDLGRIFFVGVSNTFLFRQFQDVVWPDLRRVPRGGEHWALFQQAFQDPKARASRKGNEPGLYAALWSSSARANGSPPPPPFFGFKPVDKRKRISQRQRRRPPCLAWSRRLHW